MKSKFSFSEITVVKIISLLTAAMGIVNVLSAVTPSMKDRLKLLEQYSPFGVSHGGHFTSALAGFALLLLAVSLWRRKRIGWILTVAILSISIPTHLIKGLDYEEAALAALTLIPLIITRRHFQARSDPPSVRAGLLAVLASLSFTLAYGVTGFFLLDKHFKVSFGLWDAIRQTVIMFVAFYDPGIQPITGFGKYFADSIYVVGAVSGAYALFMLLRPVLARFLPSIDERTRAWEIVRAHGKSSLARYTLLDDKLHFFSLGVGKNGCRNCQHGDHDDGGKQDSVDIYAHGRSLRMIHQTFSLESLQARYAFGYELFVKMPSSEILKTECPSS